MNRFWSPFHDALKRCRRWYGRLQGDGSRAGVRIRHDAHCRQPDANLAWIYGADVCLLW